MPSLVNLGHIYLQQRFHQGNIADCDMQYVMYDFIAIQQGNNFFVFRGLLRFHSNVQILDRLRSAENSFVLIGYTDFK